MKFKSPIQPVSLTTVERDAIISPVTGSIINNSSINTVQRYNGSAWEDIGGGGGYTPILEQVVDSVPASTSSSSYVVLGNCQITPPSAGDYLVMFVTEVQATVVNNEGAFAIFVNGVQQTTGIEKTVKFTSSNAKQELTLIAKVTYTTGTIEVRFRRAAGASGLITSSSRVLIVSK